MNCMKWLSVAVALSTSVVIAFAQNELDKTSQDPNQWVLPLGNYSGTRHSKLSQINTRNAAKLKVAWTMSTGTLRGQEGQPLVVGNMMYFESSYPNFVYAIDLDKVGQIVWKFSPEQDKFSPSVACCDLVNKGVAYADGKILVTTLDTHVYALDAKTGKVLWNAKNGDPQLGQTMTIAPLVVHDKVIVGISGGEYGVRGHLSAYDLNTGKLAWRAYSVGPDADTLMDADKTIDAATQSAGRARIPVSRPGAATSGSSAAAPPGAGIPTIPSSTWFTTAAETRERGIPRSGLGTTNGPPRCSLATPIPDWLPGPTR